MKGPNGCDFCACNVDSTKGIDRTFACVCAGRKSIIYNKNRFSSTGCRKDAVMIGVKVHIEC